MSNVDPGPDSISAKGSGSARQEVDADSSGVAHVLRVQEKQPAQILHYGG